MNEESLFAAALGKSSPADRRAFLDAVCGGDRRLRDRLERLLAADGRACDILDHGPDAAALLAVGQTDPPPGPPPHAARLAEVLQIIKEADPPGYELSEEVGEGGMGVVYRARDTRLARDVAVKLLHPRYEAGGPAARRFLGEARVTARLQHPGVPPVHQVGALPDGRPFLVMKLIRGRTLDDLLADGRDDRGRLLAAFEQVCQAVAYSHAHKVVHRDLKPHNVMVGEFAEVQVMDWGLAKVLGPAAGPGEPTVDDETTASASAIVSDRGADDATQTGSVLGTPAYMPPEQAIGAIDQIDQRSDVFGLGSILCAILIGRPPYVGTDSESIRQMAARAKLDDAFARLDGCGVGPGLVALCKRCLAAEKADRPADAGEVARAVADLRAAADERARAAELDRVRAEGEAREQRKRRRAHLALAAAVGLLLAAGGAFAWYSDRHAAQRRAQHEQNAEAVAALLDQCEDALGTNRTNQAAVALGAAERRAGDGGAEELAGRLARCRAYVALLRALDDTDTFRWTWADDAFPADGAVAARWRAALAEYGVTPDEGQATEAAEWINESPLVRDRVLTALDGWLAIDRSAGLLAVLRSADPDPYRDSVRDAVAANDRKRLAQLAGQPDALNQPAGFAVVLGQLRGVPTDRGRAVLESALLRARTGDLGLLMALGLTYPMDRPEGASERVRWYQAALAAHPGNLAALNNLGIALRANMDPDAAIAVYREAIRIDPKFARAHSNLGVALRRQGDPDGAIAAYREAIRIDPKDARAHNNLGSILLDVKRDPDGAIVVYREAIRLNPQYAHAHHGLGMAQIAKGDVDGAIASFKEAIGANPKYVNAHNDLGRTLHAKGDPDGAIAAYREAIRLDPKYAMAHHNLGNALRTKNDLDGAFVAYREAIRIDPEHVDAQVNLGNVLRIKGDLGGAIACFKEAIRLNPRHAIAHFNLGVIRYEVNRDYDGAIAYFKEAFRLDPKYADAHSNLGLALRRKGDPDGAITSYKEAIRLNPKDADAHYGLGAILYDVKRDYDGAIAAFKETIRLDLKDANAHSGLGNALQGKGNLDEAVTAFRESIRLNPRDGRTLTNLGSVLAKKGDLDGAIACFKEAIRLRPKDALIHGNLGIALSGNGDPEGAIAAYREAIRLDAKYLPARNNLAWLLAAGPDRVRDGKRAVEYAARACEMTAWKEPIHISTLAAAHAEAGDFDKAVELQKKALSFPDFEKRYGKVGRECLQLYASKKPYRDPTLALREVAPPPREVKP